MMKKMTMPVLLAVLGGLVGGFVLSEIIGAVGYLIFDQVIGVKYLPIILPIVCGGVALLIVQNKQRN
jgi:ABC-type sulfate transport system permease component